MHYDSEALRRGETKIVAVYTLLVLAAVAAIVLWL